MSMSSRLYLVMLTSTFVITIAAGGPILHMLWDTRGTLDVGSGYAFQSIQDAIHSAEEGDMIVIHGGYYNESVSIYKGVRIIGAAGERVMVYPNATTGEAFFWVTSETAVEIAGIEFHVVGETWNDSAIKVQNGEDHLIHHNRIEGGKQGIWIHGGDHNVSLPVYNIQIHDNIIANVSSHGIYMQRTYGNVYNNRLVNCGEGILVAHEWTEPPTLPGNISGNVFVNCTAGMYIYDSQVQVYSGNEFVGCDIGEVLNLSGQLSTGNIFDDCDVGTLIMNGSSPTIEGNEYTGGSTPIMIVNCSGSTISDNMMEGDVIKAIDVVWNSPSDLDHEISETNMINSDPIHYSYGETGKTRTMKGYGQVMIAGATGCNYRIEDVGTCVTSIILSERMDISGSNISKGLSITSSDVTGKEVMIDTSPERLLDLDSSIVSLFNSTILIDNEGGLTMDSSGLDLYSTEVDPAMAMLSDGSLIRQFAHIGIRLLFDDAVTPVEGGEYRISIDGSDIKATSMFGGADPGTDKDGIAGPFWIQHGSVMDDEGPNPHEIVIDVNVTADLQWEDSRTVTNMTDHLELFVTPDITAPAVPRSVQVESADDGISLSWSKNTDDTVIYRIYSKDGDAWPMRAQTPDTSYNDPKIPQGTKVSFRVTAVDEVGLESAPSIEVEGTSVDDLAPLPPTSLKITEGTGGALVLSWGRSPSLDVVLYEVFVVNRIGPSLTGDTKLGSTANTSFDLPGNIDGEGLVSVRSVDESDKRSPFYDPPIKPERPDTNWPVISDIEWTFGASRVSISFATDIPTKGDLFFGSSTTSLSSVGMDALGTEHVFRVDDLDPGTRYYFYVYAVEPSGNGVTDDNEGKFYTFVTYESESELTVLLVDEDGESVTGAQVTVERNGETVKAVETGSGVYYMILLPGNWTVKVSSADHRPIDPRYVELSNDQDLSVTIELASIGWAKANVTIVVLDPDGVPVQGAIVEIDGIEYVTGADGKATSGEVTTGSNHTVKVKAKGYQQYEGQVFVSPKKRASTTSINLAPDDDDGKSNGWIAIVLGIVALAILVVLVVLFFAARSRKSDNQKAPDPVEEEDKPEVPEDKGSDKEVKSGVIEGEKKGKAMKEE